MSRTLHRRPRVLTRAVLTGVATALATVAVGFPASAAGSGDRLNPGAQLNPGERLTSAVGGYALVMQGDGNLVEYAPGNRAVWASGTRVAGSVARMQTDGNLVVIAPGNRAVSATGTSGNPGAVLELQGDGNLVVYAPGHVAKWSSGVSAGAGTSAAGGLAGRIVSVATAELNNPARNRETGVNCNFYTTQFPGAGTPCADGRRAEAWCADFARWVWGQAGAGVGGLGAGAVSFTTYGEAHRTWRTSGPRVGDAVVFNVRRDSRGTAYTASHVGLVTAVNGDGTISTIEGNSGPGSTRIWNGRRAASGGGISGYTSPVGA